MSGLRIATTVGHARGSKAPRLVRHFAAGHRTLCGVQLAGVTVKAPEPDEKTVDCANCVKRVPS